MSISNAALAAQISAMVEQWRDREVEFATWVNGEADGGPYGDGRYPLTDYLGNVQYVPCPAALVSGTTGSAASAGEAQVAAEAAQAAAEAAQTSAETASGSAAGYRDEAEAARDLAAAHRASAENYRSQAQAARSQAQAAAAAAEATAEGMEAALEDAATAAAVAATAAAEGHASDAADSASAAASSASDASGYASAASGSASDASDSADAASASAAAAAASAAAAAVFDPDNFGALALANEWSGQQVFTAGTTQAVFDGASQAAITLRKNGTAGLSLYTGAASEIALYNNTTARHFLQLTNSGFTYGNATDAPDHDFYGVVNLETGYLYMGSNEVIRVSGGYVRLNQDGAFTNGVYTPYSFRADGWVGIGGSPDAPLRVYGPASSGLYIGYDTVGDNYYDARQHLFRGTGASMRNLLTLHHVENVYGNATDLPNHYFCGDFTGDNNTFTGLPAYTGTTTGYSLGRDGTYPSMWTYRASAGTNEKRWAWYHGLLTSGSMALLSWADDANSYKVAFDVARSGTAITRITLGNPTDLPYIDLQGNARFRAGVWHRDTNDNNRFYFDGTTTYFQAPATTSAIAYEWRNGGGSVAAQLRADGFLKGPGLLSLDSMLYRELILNNGQLSYGSAYVYGASNGWHGLAIYDGSAYPTFMSSGGSFGVYVQGGSPHWSWWDDFSYFYVNRKLIEYTSELPYMRIESGGHKSGGRVYISTSDPSGTPADGDFWVKREA